MSSIRSGLYVVLFAASFSAHAAVNDEVKCYQNGQLILSIQERIRDFSVSNSMEKVADINAGQVDEKRTTLYTTEHAGVVCVVKDRN